MKRNKENNKGTLTLRGWTTITSSTTSNETIENSEKTTLEGATINLAKHIAVRNSNSGRAILKINGANINSD